MTKDGAQPVTIHGRLMAKNTALNIAGYAAPLLSALIAVPLLIRGMGQDRFGILTIIWMVIGYFSLFDLGIGNATIKLVAEKLGEGREQEIPGLLRTSMILIGILSVAGSGLLLFFTKWTVSSVLKIPEWLQPETMRTFLLLVIAVPVVVFTACLRGVLEAYQRFDLVNLVRIPLGLATFLIPLLVLNFTADLFYMTIALVLVRALALAIHGFQVQWVIPVGRSDGRAREEVRSLLSYGGWITVSNIVGPVMVYADRFLIGSLVSVAAVSYYAVPFEISTKLWVVAGAFVGVLFPVFSATLASDRSVSARLFGRGTASLFLVLFPLVFTAIAFAREGLSLWLGPEFAEQSRQILQLIVAGVFINSFTQIAFAFVQSAGRPDVTAKAHLVELPLYLLALSWLLIVYGVRGAAAAWVLRIILDSAILFRFAFRLVPEIETDARRLFSAVGVVLAAASLVSLVHPLSVKIICLALCLVLIGAASLHLLVRAHDRSAILRGILRFVPVSLRKEV